jgi:hypothetical protein
VDTVLKSNEFIQKKCKFGSSVFWLFSDNDDYEVSWVEFKTEQLENFNWNRMDFYVCTRGDKVQKTYISGDVINY